MPVNPPRCNGVLTFCLFLSVYRITDFIALIRLKAVETHSHVIAEMVSLGDTGVLKFCLADSLWMVTTERITHVLPL